ncbi:MAG TPA: DUF4276 family protein [Phycisphaerales bacterium]|nr:DUF4276 family protein [Phycisphaerales bacterium]
MRNILIVCEGQTEREFCRGVVSPYVAQFDVALAGTLVGKPGRKRGGVSEWKVYRDEVLKIARQSKDQCVGVLVDYYAMPDSWPGRTQSNSKPPLERGRWVEKQIIKDLQSDLRESRCYPCVQYHEFESLLFTKPEISALSIVIGGASVNDHNWLSQKMSGILEDCGGNVELINDSPETAPSKRIISLVPGYDKVAWGIAAVQDIEMNVLRANCSWLDRWLTRIVDSSKFA